MKTLAALLATLFVLAGCMGNDDKANEAPKAVLKVKCTGLACQLNATGSSDPDGDKLTFTYRWAGGLFSTEKALDTLNVPATMGGNTGYKVNLVVRDGRGGASVAIAELLLGNGQPTAPTLLLPTATPRVLRTGDELVLNATATYD